jgi:multidrug resistance efflux pump
MHKNKRIIAPIIVVTLLLVAGALYLAFGRDQATDGDIVASGTVEATEVQIASELSGRVAEVMAAKGELVEAGDPLMRLDDVLLQSQRQRALTALESAQANLTTAQTGLTLAQAALVAAEANSESAAATAQIELLTASQALDDLYDTNSVAQAEMMRTIAAANRAVREAQYTLDNFTVPLEQTGLTAFEAVEIMKERLDQAREAFEPYKHLSSSNETREDRLDDLNEAQSDYDSAVKRLEYETAVKQAQARLDKALEDFAAIQDGPDPDDVALLEARIAAAQAAPKQAEAAVEQARVGVEQAEARLEQAQASVEQAQAELDLIEVQLDKLVVYASDAGVVLSRNVEPGEVIAAGAPVMSIGRLGDLTITVYVPEDRYGAIRLGEEATVTVDSFPGETFPASVVYIADQAEFTPRNVQTEEGRRSTVFAVELSIDDASGRLKPGMPADVCFGCP